MVPQQRLSWDVSIDYGARVKLLLPSLLLLLIVCAGCVAGQEQAPVSQYTLEGNILDDLSDDALAGAKVVFVSETLDKTQTRSDDRGHYAMDVEIRDGVNFGTLRAERAGYQNSIAHTVYFDGTVRKVDVRLRANGG
jgi:hypothetical protein